MTMDLPLFRATILGGWTAAAIGLVLVTAVLSAQRPDRAAPPGIWSVTCFTDAHTARPDCEVSVAISQADRGHHLGFIYRIDRNLFLAVGLPAPTRVTASVDRRPHHDLAICTGRACLLRGRLATSLRREMERGHTLRLEFPGIATEVSLSGFKQSLSEALGRLDNLQSAPSRAASDAWSARSLSAKPWPAAGLP